MMWEWRTVLPRDVYPDEAEDAETTARLLCEEVYGVRLDPQWRQRTVMFAVPSGQGDGTFTLHAAAAEDASHVVLGWLWPEAAP